MGQIPLVLSFCAVLVAMEGTDVSLSLADEPRDNDEDDANDEDDDELVQADGDDGNEVDSADMQEIEGLPLAHHRRFPYISKRATGLSI